MAWNMAIDFDIRCELHTHAAKQSKGHSLDTSWTRDDLANGRYLQVQPCSAPPPPQTAHIPFLAFHLCRFPPHLSNLQIELIVSSTSPANASRYSALLAFHWFTRFASCTPLAPHLGLAFPDSSKLQISAHLSSFPAMGLLTLIFWLSLHSRRLP